MQQQLQQLQNPLAEAETIKQKGNLIKAQSDAQLDMQKMIQDNQQFMAKLAADTDKSNKELAIRLTDLEIKAGKDLSAQNQDNLQ